RASAPGRALPLRLGQLSAPVMIVEKAPPPPPPPPTRNTSPQIPPVPPRATDRMIVPSIATGGAPRSTNLNAAAASAMAATIARSGPGAIDTTLKTAIPTFDAPEPESSPEIEIRLLDHDV